MPIPYAPRTEQSGDALADVRLLRRYAATRDPRDREQLVIRYMPLARYAANHYLRRSEPFDDLLQVACVGLLKAIDRFDPLNGASFASYALPTMLGELRRSFRDLGWTVRPPRTLLENALAVERETASLTHDLGRSPTVEELAAATDLGPEEVLEAREAAAAHTGTSLSTPVNGEDGAPTELGQLVGAVDEGFDRAEDRATVDALLRSLPTRDREIVRLRMEEDLTQSEIGRRVGLSQMHVSRVLREALNRLHAAAARRAAEVGDPAATV